MNSVVLGSNPTVQIEAVGHTALTVNEMVVGSVYYSCSISSFGNKTKSHSLSSFVTQHAKFGSARRIKCFHYYFHYFPFFHLFTVMQDFYFWLKLLLKYISNIKLFHGLKI